ncbi:MAG: type II toxin-antitoxin system RelE/ParE family toxin [Fimbriiglobus sp.]
MSTPLAFRPEVDDEIQSIFQDYEADQPGLGDRFRAALDQTLDRIEDNPRSYGAFRWNTRAATLRRFPHLVYYRIREADVLIVAVQHGRRNPRNWQDRI